MASKLHSVMYIREDAGFNERIDRPFLQSDRDSSDGTASQNTRLQRANTTAVESSNSNWKNEIPAFPLPRSMSNRRAGGYADMKPLGTAPLASTCNSPFAGLSQGPLSARPDSSLPPPPPLPKDDEMPLPEISHKRAESYDSRSSYGTASIRYDNGSKRSTMLSSRRPSYTSMSHESHSFLDDGPPAVKPAPLETLSEDPNHQDFGGLQPPQMFSEEDARYSSFDFGIPQEKNNRDVTLHGDELGAFSQEPPSHSQHSPVPSVDQGHRRTPSSVSFASQSHYQNSRKPSVSNQYLQPTGQSNDEGTWRKNSDASDFSVSNFARALGLDNAEHPSTESSTVSSDFSPSESRSGTSLSSLPSETSLSRRKASEASRLGPLVEENNNPPPNLHISPSTQYLSPDGNTQPGSPTVLEPPKIPELLQSPDSPTDPAISQGSLALVSDRQLSPRSAETVESSEPSPESPVSPVSPVSPAKERPVPIALPSPRPPVGKSKGRCRGCGEAIIGKSVSSADGRLTGKYHRECFACCYCRMQFETVDFYVLNDRPYCAQHYHELNGSLCSTCNMGIEGQYLETDERRGHGPGDRRKFHPDCLTCRTCNVALNGEYFEWNGMVYCEMDARRAAASTPPPPRFRRPTMPSSPMAPRPYPPGPMGPMGRPPYPPPGPGRRPPPMDGLVPYAGGPGPGPVPSPGLYGPPLPAPPRRFPERRTTKLMMI